MDAAYLERNKNWGILDKQIAVKNKVTAPSNSFLQFIQIKNKNLGMQFMATTNRAAALSSLMLNNIMSRVINRYLINPSKRR